MFEKGKGPTLSGDSKVNPSQLLRIFFNSVDYVSVSVRNDLKKSDLIRVGADIVLDLRFSGVKALAIVRHGLGDIVWDVRESSHEVQKELRRSLYAARKKFKEKWPVIIPDEDTLTKDAG